MDDVTLRKVQLKQLEIAKEIKRVCEENHISYFLDSGTLIGAVRHKGFIPWDDDMDIGMLREDYEKFGKIAPKALKPEFFWQTWHTDGEYPLPFGKVRMRNTTYIEERGGKLAENGFYVDIFPFDYAPDSVGERRRLIRRRVFWARIMLMKHGSRPWMNGGKINPVKRAGYLFYQFLSLFFSHRAIVERYERLVFSVGGTENVYEQIGKTGTHYYRKPCLSETVPAEFEGVAFSIPVGADERLREEYGDYMRLPPENQRYNRHDIIELDFGDETPGGERK